MKYLLICRIYGDVYHRRNLNTINNLIFVELFYVFYVLFEFKTVLNKKIIEVEHFLMLNFLYNFRLTNINTFILVAPLCFKKTDNDIISLVYNSNIVLNTSVLCY